MIDVTDVLVGSDTARLAATAVKTLRWVLFLKSVPEGADLFSHHCDMHTLLMDLCFPHFQVCALKGARFTKFADGLTLLSQKSSPHGSPKRSDGFSSADHVLS